MSCRSGDCNIHLRIEDAGRRLNNAGQTGVGLNLVDTALVVLDDGEEVEEDILGLHVQGEGEGQLSSLAGGNVKVVAHGRQVTEDTGGGGRILREGLGSRQQATDEGNVDGGLFLVRDLDNGLGLMAIDELDAKGRVREMGSDVKLQLGQFSGGRGGGILGLAEKDVRS